MKTINGLGVLNIVISGGKMLVLKLQILFHRDVTAEPLNLIFDNKNYYLPPLKIIFSTVVSILMFSFTSYSFLEYFKLFQ